MIGWRLVASLALGLAILMAIAWAIAVRSGKSGWIDAVWTFGVGTFGVAGALAPLGPGAVSTARQGLVAGLIAIWSLRLGAIIARRTMRGGDDPRYRHLREVWGASFRTRLFWLLQVQAAAALVLVGCAFVAARRPGALGAGDWLGLVILVVAVAGEAIADSELARFRADPAHRGEVCDIGLWRWSRHPNYFFEWLVWLAYLPIAADWTGVYSWGWLALAGPALMYWLLVRVSGLPPLEAHMLRSRGEAFRAYQREVNAFWPGPARGSRDRHARDRPTP